MKNISFKKWIDDTLEEYMCDLKVHCKENDGKILLTDITTNEIAEVEYSPKNKKGFNTGLAIAYAVLRNLEILERDDMND